MINTISNGTRTLTITFSSRKSLLSSVISQCDDFLGKSGVSPREKVLVVLREMIMNAIVHGNSENPKKTVCCSLIREDYSSIIITVEDQGNGLDNSNIDLNLPENPKHILRRGFPLINALSERFEVNKKGNRITAFVKVDSVNSEHDPVQAGQRKPATESQQKPVQQVTR